MPTAHGRAMDDDPATRHRSPSQLGDRAEALVAARLVAAGWTVLGRNVPCRPPRARPRGGRPGAARVARGRGGPLAARPRLRPARGDGRPRKRTRVRAAAYGLLDLGRLPDGAPLPRLPLRFDLVVVEPPARGRAGPPRVRHHKAAWSGGVRADRAANGTLCYTPAGPGPARVRAARSTARVAPTVGRHGAHTRTHPVRGGAGAEIDGKPAADRPGPRRRTSAEERTEQEVANRAVRFDAAAARGRGPLRPSDPPLESQDAPVHLRGAQRDPHHRSRPDRVQRLDVALEAVRDTVARGELVLFVGTKKQAQEPVAQEATRAGMPYVNKRWLGGMMTNFVTIKKRMGLLEQLEARQQAGDFERMTKKEAAKLTEEMVKLQGTLGGMRKMKRVPGAIFIVDPHRERIAVTEANKLEIPVIGTGDTNVDPDELDFIIPANDDAIRSIRLLCTLVADAAIEGARERATAPPPSPRSSRRSR